MTTIINANTSAGLTQTADTSGIVKLQSNGVTTNAIAWVNFAGASGTRNASYNVSSVTRNAAGDYTITFTNALTDANYSLCGMAVGYATGNPAGVCISLCGNSSYSAAPLGKTTSSVRVLSGTYAIATDSYEVSVNIFGN